MFGGGGVGGGGTARPAVESPRAVVMSASGRRAGSAGCCSIGGCGAEGEVVEVGALPQALGDEAGVQPDSDALEMNLIRMEELRPVHAGAVPVDQGRVAITTDSAAITSLFGSSQLLGP